MEGENFLIPIFGPLQGIRVVTTGSIIAGPAVGTILADLGAEVIHIEKPDGGDTLRVVPPYFEGNGNKIGGEFVCVTRNKLSVALDIKSEKGKEIFYKILRHTDIFVENLVWLEERYGITDKEMLKENPQLVIVHVSGYGRPEFGGEKEKCSRGSYDIISQAYSGWCNLAAPPGMEVHRLPLYIGDYITALFGAIGALSAYIYAKKTGKGQVVDVAQFEAIARVIEMYYMMYYNLGIKREGEGLRVFNTQPYGLYKTKDGWIAIGAIGPGLYQRFIQALAKATGINPEDFPYEECASSPEALNSEKGKKLDKIFTEYLRNHTKEEVEELFNSFRVPCSKVSTPDDVLKDKHWLDRGDIVDVLDENTGRFVKQIGIVPKFSETPGKIWRGPPKLGSDTVKVLKELLGMSDYEIEELKKNNIINF
ncbi:MAG: CaiB/BaiF CoA-transferase family protein [Archaeoglobales archaeon]|nr:CaiB/BaiF CoA-transferase family protein [Archaeoglobales archaeon]